MRRTLVIALVALGMLGAAACTPPPDGGTINTFTPDGRLVVRDLFVFSTAKGIDTPARSFLVKNVGNKNLVVTDITISGSSAFRLANGQARSFTLAPGASTGVSVIFRPGTTLGKHTASLFVHSSDASQHEDEMFLRGYNARDYENSMEPNRSQLVDAVGYKTNVGTGLPKDDVNAGEEMRGSGYFTKAANTGPVIVYPLARYSSRTIGTTGDTRWYPRGSTGVGTKLYAFNGCGSSCQLNPDGTMGPNEDGGENQKLVPQPNATTVSFNPSGAFGLSLFASGENLFSDDQRNDAPNTNSNTHNFRFWPMRDMGGALVPNAWIVGIDLGLNNLTNPTKNWDYQDFMYVLSNATPV